MIKLSVTRNGHVTEGRYSVVHAKESQYCIFQNRQNGNVSQTAKERCSSISTKLVDSAPFLQIRMVGSCVIDYYRYKNGPPCYRQPVSFSYYLQGLTIAISTIDDSVHSSVYIEVKVTISSYITEKQYMHSSVYIEVKVTISSYITEKQYMHSSVYIGVSVTAPSYITEKQYMHSSVYIENYRTVKNFNSFKKDNTIENFNAVKNFNSFKKDNTIENFNAVKNFINIDI